MKLNILTLKVFNARLNCCPKENKPRNSNFFPAKYSSFPVLSQDIFEKTKNIFFSGNEYKSDFMLNAYEEFCLQFSNEYKDASLVDIVREIFKTSQPIGQGTQKRVYDFPRLENYVVAYLYHKKPLKEERPIVKLDFDFPKYNFGQQFAGNGYDIVIMKRVDGVSNSVDDFTAATNFICENNSANRKLAEEYLSKLRLLKDFSQDAYNDFLEQIEYLLDNGQLIDCFNPNNLLLDKKMNRFHLIDLLSEEQTENLKVLFEAQNGEHSGFYEAMSLLLDSRYQCYYMDFMSDKEKAEVLKISKDIIKKLQKAIEGTNLSKNGKFIRSAIEHIGNIEPELNENFYKRYDECLEMYRDVLN